MRGNRHSPNTDAQIIIAIALLTWERWFSISHSATEALRQWFLIGCSQSNINTTLIKENNRWWSDVSLLVTMTVTRDNSHLITHSEISKISLSCFTICTCIYIFGGETGIALSQVQEISAPQRMFVLCGSYVDDLCCDAYVMFTV